MRTQQSRQRTRKSANKRLPNGLTETFYDMILALDPSIKSDYLKREVMSKYVSSDTAPAVERRTAAIVKWLFAERDNEATNERLLTTPDDFIIIGGVSVSSSVSYGSFMSKCRDIVADIIGDTPPIDALVGAFSGGASTSRARTESHPASKYLGKAHVTHRAKEVFESFWGDEMPQWHTVRDQLVLEVVPGNVMFTVPKKTDIDRCACKEPDINMFIQKGVGNHFRDSLRRIGINLNDQSRNRSLAQSGSRDGKLATLDLSSASDSVTVQLVAEMLPVCWYTLLDSIRSPVTIIDGEEHVNEMFSSMGNGFTFELESLLFYSILKTTQFFTGVSGIVSVYGDDLIIPTGMVPAAIYCLNYFGFQVNSEKSFWTGSFRESCGGHYDAGIDITPFYIKEPIKYLVDVIDLANKLRQWASRGVPDYSRSSCVVVIDPSIEAIWLFLRDLIPLCLWGGADFTFKYQLVSNDYPSRRLQPETKTRDTGLGGYLHWLNASWMRSDPTDGFETSSVSSTSEVMRLRPVSPYRRAVPQLPALMLLELYADAEYAAP